MSTATVPKITPEYIRKAEALKREAEEGQIIHFEKLRAPHAIAAAAVKVALERFVSEHVHLGGCRPGTADHYRRRIPAIVAFAREFGLPTITDFTADKAPVFAAWLGSQKCRSGRRVGEFWSVRHQNMILKVARLAWQHFLREGKATENLFAHIKCRASLSKRLGDREAGRRLRFAQGNGVS